MSDYRKKSHRRRRKKHPAGYHKKAVVATLLLVLVVAAGFGVWAYRTQQAQNALHVTAGNSVDMGSGYRNLTYKGKKYQYNSLITTVLYAGIDSQGKLEENASYSGAARADSIALVVLDKKHKKMTIISISRDTMTEVRRYSMSGRDRGTTVTNLGYAYTYGEGGKVSCENLREAVSNLLGGIPINEYAVTNQDSMIYINDLIDGVTLTVPNDDLAASHPELRKDTVVTLDAANVRDFLQYRDTSKDFSNEGRRERQQAYITAYVEQLKKKLQEDTEGIWDGLEEMEDYLQTSITKNKYLSLAKLLKSVSFSDEDYYNPEGENRLGDLHDEFYVDEEALQEKVIELFYEEI